MAVVPARIPNVDVLVHRLFAAGKYQPPSAIERLQLQPVVGRRSGSLLIHFLEVRYQAVGCSSAVRWTALQTLFNDLYRQRFIQRWHIDGAELRVSVEELS